MNKQELIATIRIKMLLASSSPERKGYIAGLEEAINIIEGFSNEPQKPVIPQFVADWIKYCKFTNVNLQNALLVGDVYFYNYANQKDFSKLKEFLDTENNQETFAKAWLFGYEVEKEKQYLVKIKSTGQCLGKYYINNEILSPRFIYTGRNADRFTRKELEDAGFGEVFNSPLFEVEEAEE